MCFPLKAVFAKQFWETIRFTKQALAVETGIYKNLNIGKV